MLLRLLEGLEHNILALGRNLIRIDNENLVCRDLRLNLRVSNDITKIGNPDILPAFRGLHRYHVGMSSRIYIPARRAHTAGTVTRTFLTENGFGSFLREKMLSHAFRAREKQRTRRGSGLLQRGWIPARCTD